MTSVLPGGHGNGPHIGTNQQTGREFEHEENPCETNRADAGVSCGALSGTGEGSGSHPAACRYEGRRTALEISCSLTDGAGVPPCIGSVMYPYLSPNPDPAEFRLPGNPIPESETGQTFSGPDIDNARGPMHKKPAAPGFTGPNRTGITDPQLTDHLRREPESPAALTEGGEHSGEPPGRIRSAPEGTPSRTC